MRKLLIVLSVFILAFTTAAEVVAKGGGGRGGGGARSSSRSSSSRSSSRTPSKPPKGTSTAKPGSKIKTSDGKEVTSSAKKPSDTKFNKSRGIIGDNGYSQRFNGYEPPAGSVVYYPQHSALDYLPWIYLFSQNSPANDQATVVQPDGKEVKAEPEKGVDGLAIFNWIVLILMGLGLIALVVWFVNRRTNY
jgi:hypothetical protein